MLKTQNASRILFLFLYKIRHSKTGRLSGELAFMLFFLQHFAQLTQVIFLLQKLLGINFDTSVQKQYDSIAEEHHFWLVWGLDVFQ